MLRLRAKTSDGLITLDTLKTENTVAELRKLLAEKLFVDESSLSIKCGFPPKVVSEAEFGSALGSLVKSGDTIVVEMKKTANDSPSNSATTDGIQSNGIANERANLNGANKKLKMARKVIPADNSCLFNSFLFCYSHTEQNVFSTEHLRELIAVTVGTNVKKYPAEVLGSDVREYQKFIRNPQSWGGAIEAAILADHFELEVRIVDIQSNRIDKFGCSQNFPDCVYLLYDGIHYDALFEPCQRKSVFASSDESVEQCCKELAKELKETNKFTDLQSFSLRCMICNALLKGQNDAQKHAINTQHINFREV